MYHSLIAYSPLHVFALQYALYAIYALIPFPSLTLADETDGDRTFIYACRPRARGHVGDVGRQCIHSIDDDHHFMILGNSMLLPESAASSMLS